MPQTIASPLSLSIIMPVLNEASGLVRFLQALQPLRCAGVELVLVDGGSSDTTFELAEAWVDQCLRSASGRAMQMNVGAKASNGDLLLFLHGDTLLPASTVLLARLASLKDDFGWGFFNVQLSGNQWWTRMIAAGINGRSRLSSVATGDQGLFVQRHCFLAIGGFPNIALMEDVAVTKALKRKWGRAVNPKLTVITSSRRWQQNGVVATILLMWWLRLLYVLGVSPARLRRLYQ